MTHAVAVLRSSVLLLLTVGVLLMHTDGTAAAMSGHGRTNETAMAMAGMAVTGSGAAVDVAAGSRGHATAADLSGPSWPMPTPWSYLLAWRLCCRPTVPPIRTWPERRTRDTAVPSCHHRRVSGCRSGAAEGWNPSRSPTPSAPFPS